MQTTLYQRTPLPFSKSIRARMGRYMP